MILTLDCNSLKIMAMHAGLQQKPTHTNKSTNTTILGSWQVSKYFLQTFIWQGINEVGHGLSRSSSCGIWPLRSAAAAGMGMLLPRLGDGLYKLRQRQQQRQGSWALGSGILLLLRRFVCLLALPTKARILCLDSL
jgi:hypothetical protein